MDHVIPPLAGLEVRVADHELAWSLYFQDPDGNTHEITSYDHEFVADRLNGS
jgi:catechol-2,3-dioxygenase